MKKSDLKNKMVVKNREDRFYLVIDNAIVGYDNYSSLSSYEEDLTHKHFSGLDIMEVYDTITILDQIRVKGLELLWKRPWEPLKGENYYYPDFANYGMFSSSFWGDNVTDERMLNDGLVFKTREEAVEMAKKMIELTKENK